MEFPTKWSVIFDTNLNHTGKRRARIFDELFHVEIWHFYVHIHFDAAGVAPRRRFWLEKESFAGFYVLQLWLFVLSKSSQLIALTEAGFHGDGTKFPVEICEFH